MTLHTQMEVSLLSRGSDLAPLCHSNYRNRARGQIRTQLNSTNLALAMLLKITFPLQNHAGKVHPVPAARGCALISRADGSGDHYAKCKDEDLVPSIESFLQSRDVSMPLSKFVL